MATRQKQKAARRAENRDRRPKAVLRYARIAPRKARAVIDQIRGKSLAEAEGILMLSPRGASEIVYKLVESAAANAENNLDMARDTLYVAEIYADGGPTLKRYRPRAQGRAASILKRTSHITVILDQVTSEGVVGARKLIRTVSVSVSSKIGIRAGSLMAKPSQTT